jgi:hypothetical protein
MAESIDDKVRYEESITDPLLAGTLPAVADYFYKNTWNHQMKKLNWKKQDKLQSGKIKLFGEYDIIPGLTEFGVIGVGLITYSDPKSEKGAVLEELESKRYIHHNDITGPMDMRDGLLGVFRQMYNLEGIGFYNQASGSFFQAHPVRFPGLDSENKQMLGLIDRFSDEYFRLENIDELRQNGQKELRQYIGGKTRVLSKMTRDYPDTRGIMIGTEIRKNHLGQIVPQDIRVFDMGVLTEQYLFALDPLSDVNIDPKTGMKGVRYSFKNKEYTPPKLVGIDDIFLNGGNLYVRPDRQYVPADKQQNFYLSVTAGKAA